MLNLLQQMLQWLGSTHVSREYIRRRETFDRSHLSTDISNEEFGRSVFPEDTQLLRTLACVIRSTLAKEVAIDPRRLSAEDDVRVIGYFTEYERWSDDRLINLDRELLQVMDTPPNLTEDQLPILMQFPLSANMKDGDNKYLFCGWIKLAANELHHALGLNHNA